MTHAINLEQVDVDGAVGEAHEAAIDGLQEGDTRLGFLRKSALVGGAAISGGALLGALAPGALAAGGRPPASFGKGDVGILNYALTLEYLETEFYEKVIAAGLYKGKVGSLIKTFGAEEQAHVSALKAAVTKLGGTPVARPNGKFPVENANQVAELAYTVENLGAAAYLGQAANIQSPEVLASALAIHSIEARHASTLGTLVHKPLTPNGAFAVPASMATVLVAIKPFLA